MLKKMYSILLGSLMLPSISTIMAMDLEIRNQAMAFLMGRHPRLGKNSPASNLPSEIAKIILQYARPKKIILKSTFKNNYICPPQQVDTSATLFFRIRDITDRENNDPSAPIIWEGYLAEKPITTTHRELGLDHPQDRINLVNKAEIPIPFKTSRIRIRISGKLSDWRLLGGVIVSNAANIQEIIADGRIYQTSNDLRIIVGYEDSQNFIIPIGKRQGQGY